MQSKREKRKQRQTEASVQSTQTAASTGEQTSFEAHWDGKKISN
jgi:hypothetical protein